MQKGWTHLKKEIMKAQEQAVPTGQKMRQWGVQTQGKPLLLHLCCRQLQLPQIWHLLITLKSKVGSGKAEEGFLKCFLG